MVLPLVQCSHVGRGSCGKHPFKEQSHCTWHSRKGNGIHTYVRMWSETAYYRCIPVHTLSLFQPHPSPSLPWLAKQYMWKAAVTVQCCSGGPNWQWLTQTLFKPWVLCPLMSILEECQFIEGESTFGRPVMTELRNMSILHTACL